MQGATCRHGLPQKIKEWGQKLQNVKYIRYENKEHLHSFGIYMQDIVIDKVVRNPSQVFMGWAISQVKLS